MSFGVPSLGELWTYNQPSGGLSIVVSTDGGGVVAKDTSNGTDSVVRLNSSGSPTADSWTASNVINFGGDFWDGTTVSGDEIQAFSAPATQVSAASWVATDGIGGHASASGYSFSPNPPSQENPHQAVIQGVLNEIFTALPLASVPGSSACESWMSTGQNSLATLQSLAPNIWFHASILNDGNPDYFTAALTNLGNGTPTSFRTVVNDSSVFFNTQYPTFGGRTTYVIQPESYYGNELLQQADTALHELAHQTAYPQPPPAKPKWKWQQFDAGKGGKWSAANDVLLDRVCGKMIRALPSINPVGDVPPDYSPGLSPTSGTVGTIVTINGNNFGNVQGSNTVSFGGVVATAISKWSKNQIKATVPSGAQTGNVVVTVGSVPTTGPVFSVQ
ncbi:MAG: IPT/TIG domain-containing protein [Candidatus Acidiferrales bacterium]